jgi:GTPase SAR1 family protein
MTFPQPMQSNNVSRRIPTVLLLGLSQSGKTSLIKSILEFGKCHREAKSLVIGDGLSAQTRDVGIHPVKFNFRDGSADKHDGKVDDTDQHDSFVQFEANFIDTPPLESLSVAAD